MANQNKNAFHFEVDLNVINHLGVGLYSSTPAALTELVANAWDADATTVSIRIDPEKRSITIEDDGHGMDVEGIKNKFLKVGYSRRQSSTQKDKSDSGKRKVMGRKGIGKLAMFALAEFIEITSQASGKELTAFEIDVPKLKESLKEHNSLELNEMIGAPFSQGHGTRIELTNVLTGLKVTEAYLRIKLARRFSILGDSYGFKLFLNKKEITKEDRGFYQHIQFLWAFDEKSRVEFQALSKNLVSVDDHAMPPAKTACVATLPSEVLCGEMRFNVSGYVASVFQPKHLGGKEDSVNILSIFANGRVFAEDVLSEANSAKYYQNYLVGELHADFLDDDDTDRATASREAIKRDDPKYQALINFVRTTLESIGEQWDEWRIALGIDTENEGNKAVSDWLDTLKSDNRDFKVAKRLMTSIQNATIHSDDAKNDAAKNILYRGAIVGFEKLRLKKQLDRLEQVSDVLSPEFAAIFSALNDVEEAAYAEIIRQRLEIIKKFKDIVDNPSSLEKVAQTYLFDHLWLLDPSWDRVTGRAEMEKTLTAYIKKADSDSTGARLDITYRASSGRHVVVELKKPSKTSLKYVDLFEQSRKYKNAVEEYYKTKEPNKPVPPLDIYLLIAKTPEYFSESDRNSLAAQNARIITYSQLINDANSAYQAYIDANQKTGILEAILAKL